ncbi:MAG: ABC transporter ATP-binding protein [Candidatus Nanopelagicales bacterium]|jgi:branched-chain amino acid transport system ATP-binding protein|tara:strand:+ start:1743 stop:2459 length:717 start_codon:yes stop_codon:yes gene_type:complete
MSSVLEIQDLHAGYGDLEVLHGVNLSVEDGDVVSVVGANGAGKSTLLGAISGLVPATKGSIIVDGVDITKIPAHRVIRHGVTLVPEGRKLFPFLTVEENLKLGAYHKSARAQSSETLAEVYDLFPRMTERRTQLAGLLSGGEQQMCAIGRGLMSKPRILMLDEPSLGLAPIIVEQMFGLIKNLAANGLTILLVEQNVADALELSKHANVLEQGHITMTGTGAELLASPDLQAAYLGFS